MVLAILKDPAYAGAYVYGRQTKDPSRRKAGRPHSGIVRRPIDEWPIVIHNVYPAYITWETFLANQAQLAANQSRYREDRPGTPKKGQALLQGILRCGRCGARMRLRYSGDQGEFPVYECSYAQSEYGAPRCQEVRGLGLDAEVEHLVLEALAPDKIALALAAAGCASDSGKPAPAASGGPAPVVLVSIDTLRSDRLPVYGYTKVDTPQIDRLREDGILFRNAFTHVPLTLPAHASMLTGLLPTEHGVRENLGYDLDGPLHPSLPRLLREQGYATAAAVSALVVRAETGLDEGFELYDDALSVDRRQEAETEAEVARLDLEAAEENRRAAELELRRAMAVLERRTIRSPISGYVVENLLSAGEVVDEETILRLARIDPLQVEVILPSTHYGAIQPGMRGEVTPEGPGAEVHEARVSVVDRIIDPASSTFGVRLELPNPEHTIPGGLRCQVRFLAEDS